MNRIDKTLKENDNILSIYFTAGYPHLKVQLKLLKI